MKIINLKDVPTSPIDMEGVKNLTKQTPIGAIDGTPGYSFRVFTIAKDGHTPYHIHPYEHLNYVIAGKGAIKNEAGKETPIEAGYFSLIMPNEKHQYLNTSDKDLVVICAVPKEKE